jgi:hypothetical protein
MALFQENLLNEDTLIYSGIPVFVFAVIYYFLLKNSYCNKAEVLCKNPTIINSEIQPNKRGFISQSADSIKQRIKCEPLPVTELQVYSKTTNKWIALYGLILMGIIGLLLIVSYNPGSGIGKYTIFNSFGSDKNKKFKIISNFILIALAALTLTNYFAQGYESESIWLLLAIIFVYNLAIIILYRASTSTTHNFELQEDILIVIIFIIAFVASTSFRYINNLEIGHAFTSSGSIATFIIQLVFIILMGLALFDNTAIFDKNSGMYLIYIAIFITIVIQTVLLGNHIYKCIWKTYECEPEIDIQKNKDTAQLNINCVAKLDINKTMMSFILLAILFMILPNKDVIDLIKYIINQIVTISKQFGSGINGVISNISAMLNNIKLPSL